MGEVYTGPKFTTKFAEKTVPVHPLCDNLIDWCHKIADFGMFPPGGKSGNAGNLSFRTSNGFIITGAGTVLAKILPDQVAEVTGIDLMENIVHAKGLVLPSSESLMHFAIYSGLPDVSAVIHGHYDRFFEVKHVLNIPETDEEVKYGTHALGIKAVSIMNDAWFILLKNHGFVSAGENLLAAGETLIKKLKGIEG